MISTDGVSAMLHDLLAANERMAACREKNQGGAGLFHLRHVSE